MKQYIDKPKGEPFCRPGCTHGLCVYRGKGFKPSGRLGVKGRANLCAVVDVAGVPGRPEYLTACGDVLGTASISHRDPNCTKCRRALRASNPDLFP